MTHSIHMIINACIEISALMHFAYPVDNLCVIFLCMQVQYVSQFIMGILNYVDCYYFSSDKTFVLQFRSILWCEVIISLPYRKTNSIHIVYLSVISLVNTLFNIFCFQTVPLINNYNSCIIHFLVFKRCMHIFVMVVISAIAHEIKHILQVNKFKYFFQYLKN